MTDRLRLLVVDDDLVDRLAIRRSVEQSGLDASIEEVSDSNQAAAKLEADHFDCVLLDQDLPGLSGVDLAKQLRDGGNLTPIVFVTGRQDEELR